MITETSLIAKVVAANEIFKDKKIGYMDILVEASLVLNEYIYISSFQIKTLFMGLIDIQNKLSVDEEKMQF